jgi:hypothetical protein
MTRLVTAGNTATINVLKIAHESAPNAIQGQRRK